MSDKEQILEKFIKVFTPDEYEIKKFPERLASYDAKELKNLNENFDL